CATATIANRQNIALMIILFILFLINYYAAKLKLLNNKWKFFFAKMNFYVNLRLQKHQKLQSEK
ncbi:MAG: hypothetical protein IKM98_09170, partial [Bacteroidales bacterium]|nr:hypothetical protein [Bacteroidales bacterium]